MQRCLALHDAGMMPTLDLELTAKCTAACCIYCDSKPEPDAHPVVGTVGVAHPDELTWPELKHLLQQAVDLGLEWIYTCGLGEPLQDPNFWQMLDFISAHGVRLSMFTNGIFIQDKFTAQRLKSAGVCIILKMDTFDERKFDTILGAIGKARRIYRARDLLLESGYADDTEVTDLAFSIVPTALSIDSIPDVVDYCRRNQIFASIGELEHAGEVMKNDARVLNDLALTDKQIRLLKEVANEYAGQGRYLRPICPSILTGVHIDYVGNAVADRLTGLNCKWFLLSEPDVHVFGNIRSDSLSSLLVDASEYRRACFATNATHISQCARISYVFGGCGGNPRDIMELTRKHQLPGTARAALRSEQ